MAAPQVPQITTPAPNRNDPDTFSPRMDTFLGEFPSVITGINTVADFCEDEANRAETEADASAASATASQTSRLASETARDASEGFRDEAEGFKDTAEVAAAAAQSAAGLPSLVGNGGNSLKVNGAENGVEWGPGIVSLYTVFTASGDFEKNPNASWVMVECIAGGGSGGGRLRLVAMVVAQAGKRFGRYFALLICRQPLP